MSPSPATPESLPNVSLEAFSASLPRAARSTAAHAYATDLLQEWAIPGPPLPTFEAPIPALEWAQSGAQQLTGDRFGPPEFANGPVATAARGLGALLAHFTPGRGFEALDASALLGERAALSGLQRAGARSAGGGAQLLETKSGFIAVNLPREDDWLCVPAWLRADFDVYDECRDAALTRAVALRKRDDLIEQGRLLGLAVAPAARPTDPTPPAARLRNASETHPQKTGRTLRLLDLSTLWAGPLATSLLSQAGIEVLKIESPLRPDGARHGEPAFFDLMNAGKQGVALDLTRASDRVRFEALLERADIVVESARPRALEHFGFLAQDWVQARPGRIWSSITGYGRSDPERDWIAYGDDAAIAAGLGWPCDTADRRRNVGRRDGYGARGTDGATSEATPRFCGDAIADPLAGLHAAALTLALSRSGRGGLLDLSLVGCAARAARHDAGPLSLEIDEDVRGYGVRLGADRFRIEDPRARPLRGSAPILHDREVVPPC